MQLTESPTPAEVLRTPAADTLRSLPMLNLNAGRDALLAYFENTWALTEMLFSALNCNEAYYLRPYHKTRHPLIFYFAHPACLYVNKLLVSGLIQQPVNQAFELLFETGVDEMTWDDLHEGDQDVWPSVEAVSEYRQQVYRLVKKLLQTHPIFDAPITQDSPAWAMVMAFEHERIHLETSSVLMRELPVQYLTPPAGWPALAPVRPAVDHRPVPGRDHPRENPMIKVKACTVHLGKPRAWPTFGWDNEYGSEQRHVDAFKASQCLISNGEFYRFVAAGGYEQAEYWGETGWRWRQFRNVKWPTFWVQDGPAGSHRYRLRTTFEVIDMQWDWPAVVNWYEAKAYCAWLTATTGATRPYRLLSEAEHNALRGTAWQQAATWTPGVDRLLALDPVMGEETDHANLNLRLGSESAVNAMPANRLGFHDVQGNVWQWCEDPFHPLPGFEIHPYYTDFSTPCFDNQHQMILGGSFISTGDEASLWSRFHFRPHFFQHAGFRVVQGAGLDPATNKYEHTDLVDQYLLFHFGDHHAQRDHELAQRIAFPEAGDFITHTVELMNRFSTRRTAALDLGCAVGRASFELARTFGRVVGLDYSRAFIRTANQLQAQGSAVYRRVETGSFLTELNASVAADIDRSRVTFVEGDACALTASQSTADLAPYDAILLSNLMCRLPDPAACLRQFIDSDQYLRPGGVLVIASPNTWMAQYTPVERFLDGADSAGTLARLGALLTGFERLHEEDFPFLIREHRRKYEFIISQISVWRKPQD